MKPSKYTVIWIVLFSLVMTSCTKESPAYNRENIKATWIFDTKDGSLIPEKEYIIYKFQEEKSFQDPKVLSMEGIENQGEGNYKWGTASLTYDVYCSDLEISGSITGFNDISGTRKIEQEYEIIEQKDSSLTIKPILYKVNNTGVIPDYSLATMRKLPREYESTDSLIGVWEVNSIDGVAVNTFRLEFLKEEGKLNFYLKDANGAWTLLDAEGEDYYNPYPEFVIITLFNNELLGVTEKWDVSFFNIVSIFPFSKKEMTLLKGNQEYSFNFIDSKEEGEDETV